MYHVRFNNPLTVGFETITVSRLDDNLKWNHSKCLQREAIWFSLKRDTY